MNEIMRGARYTFGGLVVMTAWSIGAVQFVEWKLERQADSLAAEDEAHEKTDYDAMRRFGPGRE